MKKKQQRPKYISPFVYWTPRIFSIIFILFLALFSLDVFDICHGFSECALGLFMHNIPAVILAIALIIAWKHEIVGAITFFLGGMVYTGIILHNALTGTGGWIMLAWIIQIAGPAFFIGILFLAGWLKKREHNDLLLGLKSQVSC